MAVTLMSSAGLMTPVASAQDNQGIVSAHRMYDPIAATGWNGQKVFLSSPRHRLGRGECGLTNGAGWEENVNGREWNRYAALGQYHIDVFNPTSPGRNFRTRGYKVTVGANPRDEGFVRNRTVSNNWNSTVHIVSHTNAITGCPASVQRTEAFWKRGDANGFRLASRLGTVVGSVAPGGTRVTCSESGNPGPPPGSPCGLGGLAELDANARWKTYMELVFHDNRYSQRWMRGGANALPTGRGAQRYSWRYGAAVDNQLGYPR